MYPSLRNAGLLGHELLAVKYGQLSEAVSGKSVVGSRQHFSFLGHTALDPASSETKLPRHSLCLQMFKTEYFNLINLLRRGL